jgi:hypothetical protein
MLPIASAENGNRLRVATAIGVMASTWVGVNGIFGTAARPSHARPGRISMERTFLLMLADG